MLLILTRHLLYPVCSYFANFIVSPFHLLINFYDGSFTAPVYFERLQAHDLLLPPNANISGLPIGTRLLKQPKIVYEGSVTVKGSLKVRES